MNAGQEKFYGFIMQNVAKENQEKAKKLLSESFTKQDNGTFTSAYLADFIPKMLKLIKPENVEQVENIMINHNA